MPLSGGIVLCDGIDTTGFLRVRSGGFAVDPRDNLTVFVQGVVNQDDRSSGAGATNPIGATIALEGASHTLILNEGGSIKFGAEIIGAFPAFSVLGGSADSLAALGDGAFLNVTGGTVGNIVLQGNDANATVSGGLLDLVVLNGANPVFDMTAGLIADTLRVLGDNAVVTIENPTGLVNGLEVIGTNASLVFDGAQSFERLRVEGTNAVSMLNGGMIDGGAEIFGQDAVLTNNAIINGGVTSGGNAIIDNRNTITGEIFMTGPGGQLLNFGSATTSAINTNAVFGTGADTVVDNRDTISTTGNNSDAIVLEGDDSTVTNRSGSEISTTGDNSTAVFFDSDGATVTNAANATISTMGDGSSGVFIDGDGGTLNNSGSVTTAGEIAPALSVFGFNGVLDNDADVQTDGMTSFGLLLATSRNAGAPGGQTIPQVTNSAMVMTSGSFSSAVVGLGTELEIINETGGEINTSGDEAHGIALGFQDAPPIPVGIAIPLGVFDPASGTITNNAGITTNGLDADGIHVFANGTAADKVLIINDGVIQALGAVGSDGIDASGDFIRIEQRDEVTVASALATGLGITGENGEILNLGRVSTSLVSTTGLIIVGLNASIVNGNVDVPNDSEGVISTTGDNAHAIVLGEQGAAAASTGSATNAGNITTTGAAADGIRGFVDSSTIVNLRNITVEGDGAFAISVTGTDPTGSATRNTVTNEGSIVGGQQLIGSPVSKNSGGIRFDGRTTVTNEVDAGINVFGDGARAIVAGENTPANDAIVQNFGTISVDAVTGMATGRGIDVTGDNVHVQNGQFLESTVPDNAIIEIMGADGIGIRTSGVGTTINNSVLLSVDGADSRGIQAEITNAGSLWIDNDARISVRGDRSIGIEVRSIVPNVNVILPTASPSTTFCSGGGPTGGKVINCGTIALNDATDATGMLVEGIADSFIENQSSIVGTADGQKGMVVNGAAGAAPGDIGFNIIANFDTIDLLGTNTRGIVIGGDGNFLVNGTGDSPIDLDPTDDQVFGLFLSTMLDRASSRGSTIGPVGEQKINSKGVVNVAGLGAVALEITGVSNFVTNRFTQVAIQDQDVINAFSELIATGAGSIGVKLGGSRNLIDNQGVIRGDALGIQGGAGQDFVINTWRIEGGVSLGANDDAMIVQPTAQFVGLVDGGSGIDLLRLESSFLPGPTAVITPAPLEVLDLDGDQFVNFEIFEMDFLDVLNLTNRLSVATADLQKGFLNLVDATLEANNVTIQPGAALGGNGIVTVTPDAQSGQIVGRVELLPGGGIKIGNSPGTIEINGDLDFGGLLEVEVDSLLSGGFDQLIVNGNVLLQSTASIDFVFSNGFAPQTGDNFNFLFANSFTGDLNLIDFAIFGLQDGFMFDVGIDGNGLMFTALNDGVSTVPLPPALMLFLTGLLSAGLIGRRKRT